MSVMRRMNMTITNRGRNKPLQEDCMKIDNRIEQVEIDEYTKECVLRLTMDKEEAREKIDCSNQRIFEILHQHVQVRGLDSLALVFQATYLKLFKYVS